MARASKVFLAVDLGAESGRTVAGEYDGRRLRLRETHRFGNGPVRLPDGLHWDSPRQFTEIVAGIRAGAARYGRSLVSAGVDTWGVDYALLDGRGALLGLPHQYRDARTEGLIEASARVLSAEEIYRRTGVGFMPFNTLLQLWAMARIKAPALAAARTLLFMPDLFHFWLTGVAVNEWTIASTSQCFKPRARRPDAVLLKKFGIPARMFPAVVEAGTTLGPLLPHVAADAGAPGLRVVAPAGHDTASAVAAVPAGREPWAFLSSGTWSLMGVETRRPCATPEARAANLTNEGGVFGTTRLLKNIMGLWIVQECRRHWQAEGRDFSYAELAAQADAAPAFAARINPLDPWFYAPGNMPKRLREYCRRTGQRAPSAPGGTIRTVLESLALAYRQTFDELAAVTGVRLRALHIVGGGSQNAVLNRMTAAALGVPVIAGPVEATAAGNILMQMKAAGEVSAQEDLREVVRRSFRPAVFAPGARAPWDEAYERFRRLPTALARP